MVPPEFYGACLAVFTKDAAVTACRYARAKGRSVTERDMCRGLKYQAISFLDQDEDTLLQKIQLITAEGEECEEEEEEEEGEEGEEGEEEEDSITDEELESLVQKIEEIERSWDNWQPEDDLMLIIKTSIDRAALEYLL